MTDGEVVQLREEIEKRAASLPQLVAEQLDQGQDKESPLPHPGLA